MISGRGFQVLHDVPPDILCGPGGQTVQQVRLLPECPTRHLALHRRLLRHCGTIQ